MHRAGSLHHRITGDALQNIAGAVRRDQLPPANQKNAGSSALGQLAIGTEHQCAVVSVQACRQFSGSVVDVIGSTLDPRRQRVVGDTLP